MAGRRVGIKAHTIIRSEDNQPCFIRYTEAAKHDHLLLKDAELHQDSILCFDKDQLASDDPQKPNSAEMGFLKHGFGRKTTPDELYQCQKLL